MSAELYIQGYSSAGEDGLVTGEVLELFSISSAADEHGFYPLNYDETNACDLSIQETSGKAIAVVVMRPCGDDHFWELIFALLSRGPYLAFMPGSPVPLLVNASVTDYLPDGMSDALGKPEQVASADELKRWFLA